jgi:hypothetical protein
MKCFGSACLFLTFAIASPAGAAPQTERYIGAGYTLTITYARTYYTSSPSTLHGRLLYSGHAYHVEGDWIPAASQGGDLLRIYGHPFLGQPFVGLVSVATLYNTCDPDCADGLTYALTALQAWRLPGGIRNVHLVKR